MLALLVRHGKTEFNDPRNPKLRAWEDLPLSREGEIEADLTGIKLRDYSPKIIYHSDLTRDTQTAHRIAAQNDNIPTEPDFDFRTADMGQWTGMDEKELMPFVKRWYENPWEPAPGGEPRRQFLWRFLPKLDEKIELARSLEAFRPVVVVAHGRNQAETHARYSGVEPWLAKMAMPGGFGIIWENPGELDSFEFVGQTEQVLEDA